MIMEAGAEKWQNFQPTTVLLACQLPSCWY